jgi:hypothetical protein
MNKDERIANIIFASVYPYYKEKVEKKWRTEDELLEVISWLTGYSNNQIISFTNDEQITFQDFFNSATLNVNANLITWVICWYKVQDIENKLTQKIRYLDKLVDELAKWKDLKKILRSNV